VSGSGSSSDDSSSGDGSSTDKSELPAVDFSTFMLSLAHSALMHLGDAPDPTGGAAEPDLAVAKQTIDLIALLSEKTKGNLTGEEERIIEQLLYDLRSRYVSAKSEK
jgi:hypothetical protein